ncbi:hypothetical protein ACSMCT_23180, partial [Salmonella enterica]|uniref:hypothetical protein n=1 Tax=Salmonella enterica TaxID=28901 RepID=UPI003F1DC930
MALGLVFLGFFVREVFYAWAVVVGFVFVVGSVWVCLFGVGWWVMCGVCVGGFGVFVFFVGGGIFLILFLFALLL